MNIETKLHEKEALRDELMQKIEATEDIDELNGLKDQLIAVIKDIEDLKEIIKGENANESNEGGDPENRSALRARQSSNPVGGLRPLATYGLNQTKTEVETGDIFSTNEYRSAFRDYVVNGTAIPSKFREQRADALTVVGDISAVIPTTIMNRVVEEALSSGMILPKVTSTSYQGGIEIPVSELKPTAVWITEDAPSSTQKKEVSSKIIFAYHILECRVALGLLSANVSLPIFETTIINNIREAMIVALETSIIKGSGSGTAKGVLLESIKANRKIALTDAEISTVKGWASVEAAIPLAYESGSYYIMAKSTWEKYLNGATDTNGQKLGFVSISDNQKRILNGREVLLTDYIPGFDSVATGDVFAVVVKLDDYILNSNMNMTYKKYYDEDKNKWVHKSIMIADGKMADTNGLIFVTKG